MSATGGVAELVVAVNTYMQTLSDGKPLCLSAASSQEGDKADSLLCKPVLYLCLQLAPLLSKLPISKEIITEFRRMKGCLVTCQAAAAQLDGYGLTETARTALEGELAAVARGRLESCCREAAHTALPRMKDRFQESFGRDEAGMPRTWGPRVSIPAAAAGARSAAARVLAQLAVLRIGSPQVPLFFYQRRSEEDLSVCHGAPRIDWVAVQPSPNKVKFVPSVPPGAIGCPPTWVWHGSPEYCDINAILPYI